MSRDSMPTNPEGMSAVLNQMTVLWMEIGSAAVYQLGPRSQSGGQYIYIRGAQTVMRDRPYLAGLEVTVQFYLQDAVQASSRRATTPVFTAPEPVIRDQPRGITPIHPSNHPPSRTTMRVERVLCEYAGIETLDVAHHLKRLHIRQPVTLQPHQGQVWVLMFALSNLPESPRIIRPSEAMLVAPGHR